MHAVNRPRKASAPDLKSPPRQLQTLVRKLRLPAAACGRCCPPVQSLPLPERAIALDDRSTAAHTAMASRTVPSATTTGSTTAPSRNSSARSGSTAPGRPHTRSWVTATRRRACTPWHARGLQGVRAGGEFSTCGGLAMVYARAGRRAEAIRFVERARRGEIAAFPLARLCGPGRGGQRVRMAGPQQLAVAESGDAGRSRPRPAPCGAALLAVDRTRAGPRSSHAGVRLPRGREVRPGAAPSETMRMRPNSYRQYIPETPEREARDR
jgi:hypothetical protein